MPYVRIGYNYFLGTLSRHGLARAVWLLFRPCVLAIAILLMMVALGGVFAADSDSINGGSRFASRLAYSSRVWPFPFGVAAMGSALYYFAPRNLFFTDEQVYPVLGYAHMGWSKADVSDVSLTPLSRPGVFRLRVWHRAAGTAEERSDAMRRAYIHASDDCMEIHVKGGKDVLQKALKTLGYSVTSEDEVPDHNGSQTQEGS